MAFSFAIHSLRVCLFSENSCGSTKIYCQTGEFQSKFHSKNRYRTHCFVIRAISAVFSIKFMMEFTSEAMNFSTEESKENGLIITATEKKNTDNLKPFIFTNPTGIKIK